MYELKQPCKKKEKKPVYCHSINRAFGAKGHIIQACGKRVSAPNPIVLEYITARRSTTCIILYEDKTGTVEMEFESGGGEHAEEKAIRYLKGQVDAGNIPKGICQVVFSVSKSPCSSNPAHKTRTDGKLGCQEQLEALQSTSYKGVGFAIVLIVTKPYQPHFKGGKDASKLAAQSSSLSFFPFIRE